MANGNHDSPLVAKFARDAGWTVLDGDVVDVKGVRILGDHDVLQTRIGVASHQSGDVSPGEQSQALSDKACDAEKDGMPGVDLLLIHDPTIGTVPLESGCVPAQVSGHLHRRIDPTQIGLGIRYVNSSTAGATLGQATVGPLHGTAEMTVLRFDTQTHRFVDWQLVSVTKKGSRRCPSGSRGPSRRAPRSPRRRCRRATERAAAGARSPEHDRRRPGRPRRGHPAPHEVTRPLSR
ncbi:hypothetical protein GCM10025864_05850 [Luteimicrobium album]|uniref:Calcineurin-like phosphoesterase domain-containing protein n=2 Tax=Luteimicrobium album TaxID=1054550 RepID=A0ABQ6HWH5_9MICO|nr:hypothetical protein GCM10025864_05850 [Luteimicrobium album]